MNEEKLARLIMGQRNASLLMTDAYKFSMAQAGFPLRFERFYMTFRKAGRYMLPFDLAEVMRFMIPTLPDSKESGFLQANGYGLTPAMERAVLDAHKNLEFVSPEARTVVREREPYLVTSGSSFMASWPEPLAIRLRFPIQVASAVLYEDRTKFICSCEDEAEIVRLTLQAIDKDPADFDITVNEEGYRRQVRRRVMGLQEALVAHNPLGRTLERAFEVGMRAVSCEQQARIASEECRKGGLLKTSNCWQAYLQYLIPVGTTGHEHQMRWAAGGGSDADGYRAIRDMRPEPPSYLPDTTHTMLLGIPEAIEVLREEPDRPATVRFDNRDEQDEQLKKLVDAGVDPSYVFEDGYDDRRTAVNELFLVDIGLDRERALYGYGGWLLGFENVDWLSRSDVSCVYKLCQSGPFPVMKHSDTGKESIPGNPMVYRRVINQDCDPDLAEFDGLIAQRDEEIPGFAPADPYNEKMVGYEGYPPGNIEPTYPSHIGRSPKTREMILVLKGDRDRRIEAAGGIGCLS